MSANWSGSSVCSEASTPSTDRWWESLAYCLKSSARCAMYWFTVGPAGDLELAIGSTLRQQAGRVGDRTPRSAPAASPSTMTLMLPEAS